MCRKPFKTIDQLVDLLYGRGLICKDREELRLFLIDFQAMPVNFRKILLLAIIILSEIRIFLAYMN